MRLPDGSILMHDAIHAYDPVKAHEYYLKVRKLKGRKSGAVAPKAVAKGPAKKTVSPAAKAAAYNKFLESLPMVIEGADLKTADAFVKSLQGKSDAALRAEAAKIKQQRGDNDGAQVATINKLIEARTKAKAGSPKPVTAKPAPAKGLPATKPAATKPPAVKLSPKQKAEQRATVKKRVTAIRQELADLNKRLKEKMAEAKQAEAKAKQGPTASEKSQSARDAKKYRDKNAQKIANKAKKAAAKDTPPAKSKQDTVESLQNKIAEVKGRLTAANEKLRSLS